MVCSVHDLDLGVGADPQVLCGCEVHQLVLAGPPGHLVGFPFGRPLDDYLLDPAHPRLMRHARRALQDLLEPLVAVNAHGVVNELVGHGGRLGAFAW